jgi:hypothetical protein
MNITFLSNHYLFSCQCKPYYDNHCLKQARLLASKTILIQIHTKIEEMFGYSWGDARIWGLGASPTKPNPPSWRMLWVVRHWTKKNSWWHLKVDLLIPYVKYKQMKWWNKFEREREYLSSIHHRNWILYNFVAKLSQMPFTPLWLDLLGVFEPIPMSNQLNKTSRKTY